MIILSPHSILLWQLVWGITPPITAAEEVHTAITVSHLHIAILPMPDSSAADDSELKAGQTMEC